MTDFSDIENDLAKLRPRQPSAELIRRVEEGLAQAEEDEKIVRPPQFRFSWVAAAVGLAAAAVLVIFARVQWEERLDTPRVTQQTPVPGPSSSANGLTVAPSAPAAAQFIPAAATEVVYATRDEGLHFAGNSIEPVRRIRSRKRETLRWNNPVTGASLQVSYPTEQVELIPVSGQ